MKEFIYDVMNEETGEITKKGQTTGKISDDFTVERVEFFFSFGDERAVNVKEIK